MLDNRKCEVETAADLDGEIRDILALQDVGRDDEIAGTLHVYYSNESVKQATQLGQLEQRGVLIVWHRRLPTTV
jgi:hypothetical protein